MKLDKLNRLATEYLMDWTEQATKPQRNPWGRRAVLQLQYAVKLLEAGYITEQEPIEDAIESAWKNFNQNGAITRDVCELIEDKLSPFAKIAKRLCLVCIGHAHIDMNWMWAYDETVSITLETFRTMLTLMDEYPQFTFAQSQASVYEIVEKHNPQMLEEIRKYVQEERWELTASTWVETDRNMPNGESMARHLLYTRDYLTKLFGVNAETLNLDYEPDTFGHHENVPEILANAGVRFYYHCRGYDKHVLYKWQAPSGRDVLVFRDPLWYNWLMDGKEALIVPQFCMEHGLNSMLRVYGVGDHGGGPTRRDLEQIIEMNRWPIFPTYRFGTYKEFYESVESVKEKLPVVKGELNFIFDGCYTTQSKIKRGNRYGEALLYRAEGLGSFAKLLSDSPYDRNAYATAWKNIMFNQFHDILPGSGVAETREHASALYQQAFAMANSQLSKALQDIDSLIDSSALVIGEDISLSRSEGAGVGYPTGSIHLSRSSRHAGLRRLFTLWNPLPYERDENCEITVWDWEGDCTRMQWKDINGKCLEYQLISGKLNHYWGHLYQNVLVKATIPPMGYTTVILDEKSMDLMDVSVNDPRVDKSMSEILENDQIRVKVSLSDGSIISFKDKCTGQEYVKPDESMCVFNLIEEDPERGMTAWVVGRYRKIIQLGKNVGIKNLSRNDGSIRQSLVWTMLFGNGSRIETTISLDKDTTILRFDVKVTWQEMGNKESGIPQLSFSCPTVLNSKDHLFSVPMGEVKRSIKSHDVPATLYGIIPNTNGRNLALFSDSKYGYRAFEGGLSLTLIRSSYDPDPWPEIGEHRFSIGVALVENSGAFAVKMAETFCQPIQSLASKAKKGSLAAHQSMFEFNGENVVVSAIKLAEKSDNLIIRLHSMSDMAEICHMMFFKKPKTACIMDLHELSLPESEQLAAGVKIDGQSISYKHAARSIITLSIGFH